MRHERLLVVVLLTFVLSMQASTSRATTAARDIGGAHPFLMSPSSPANVPATAPAPPQDPTGVEASLEPDGLFGPPTRAAIRDWQQSREAPPTGYLNGAEAELLRAAAAPLQAVPAAEPNASSAAPPSASTTEADSNPATPIVATQGAPPNAAAPNAEPAARTALGSRRRSSLIDISSGQSDSSPMTTLKPPSKR